jgi:sugar fermentation stimulation protein A
MVYPSSLIEAQFLKRYKRFFSDIRLSSGEIVVAHVPNTGSLRGLCDSSAKTPTPCRLLKSNDPKRKLAYTLEQVAFGDFWVGVNTHRANELSSEAFQNKKIPHWHSYTEFAREVKISDESRLDLCLKDPSGNQHFVEVKSVTLAESGRALFPDAETTRGQKHLKELMALQKKPKTTSEILFVVQRGDCTTFSPAESIDPEYARLLRAAQEAGVVVSAYPVNLTETSAEIDGSQALKIEL